jgi:hypothetical protein
LVGESFAYVSEQIVTRVTEVLGASWTLGIVVSAQMSALGKVI